MLDTVKPTATAVWIVPGPFRCASVGPEGADQARTFQYIVVRSTKYRSKALGVSFAMWHICFTKGDPMGWQRSKI